MVIPDCCLFAVGVVSGDDGGGGSSGFGVGVGVGCGVVVVGAGISGGYAAAAGD